MMMPERQEDPRGISELTLVQGEAERLRSRDLSSEIPPLPENPKTPQIPGYRLSKLLGEGAHAQVWRATQERTQKEVAVKVYLKQKGLNWLFLQREVERLIRLDKHPNITTLLDADLRTGTPFYAMELMERGSLEKLLRQGKKIDPLHVGYWMRDAAEALSYVHAKGLIHCDIKPANLLMDEQERVRVADFGQSRILASEPGSLGSMCYMAPEQAVISRDEAPLRPTPQWDIYALGAVAYALLLDEAPLEREIAPRLKETEMLDEQLGIYQEALRLHPPRLEGMAEARGVDKDLAAIIDKCLELEPSKRYASPDELLADLKARRKHRPVSALSGHPLYKLVKFLQRNTLSTILGLMALALSVLFISRDIEKRREITKSSVLLHAQKYAESGDAASAAVAFGALNVLDPSAYASANAQAYLRLLSSPGLQWSKPPVGKVALFAPDGKNVVLARGRALVFYDASSGRERARLRHPSAPAEALFSADGSLLASACKDGELLLWDLKKPEDPRFQLDFEAPISHLRFSKDGKSLLAMSGDKELHLIRNLDSGSPNLVLHFNSQLRDASFSPDASLILSVEASGRARLWEAASLKQVWQAAAHKGGAEACAFAPNGTAFATGGDDRELRFWELKKVWSGLKVSGLGRKMLLGGKLKGLCFSPRGRQILAWGEDNAARVFSYPSGISRGKALEHQGWIRAAAFSPDGKRVLSAGDDKSLRQWAAATGEPLGGLMSHEAEIFAVAFSPFGESALSLSEDGVARAWDLVLRPAGRKLPLKTIASMKLSPIGQVGKLSLLRSKKGLALADASGGPRRELPIVHPGKMLCAEIHPSGHFIVSGGEDKTLRFWDILSGESVAPPMECPAAVDSIRFGEDGSYVLGICKAAGIASRFETPWASKISDPKALLLKAEVIARRIADPAGKVRALNDKEMSRLSAAYYNEEP
jgi:WD40 repeat protein/serine/threonine protein kinase